MEIDRKLRSVVVKPLVQAKILNPMDMDKEFHEKDKKELFERYRKDKNFLVQQEVKRRKQNSKYRVVREFDCGVQPSERKKWEDSEPDIVTCPDGWLKWKEAGKRRGFCNGVRF